MIHDLTGQMIGHYQIIRPIEQGGMATVYLARDIHLQRQVAIKVFRFEQDERRTHEFFRRFTREAQVVARLDHPNILLVHDYGEQDSLAYLVMPYFAHGSLKQLLQKRGHLPIPEALDFIFQLLNALQYAHDRGLIHRDIKPGNILFKNDQTPVLADFGLVKETVTGNTGETTTIGFSSEYQHPLTNGAIMGTPYYMAPEQIRGRVQSQSDIYSIGLVFYEMLTGRLPFVADTQDTLLNILLKQMNDLPLPVTDFNPSISSQLGEAIMRALEKDVVWRYQRPSDFSEALRTAAQQSIGSFSEIDGDFHLSGPGYNDDPSLNDTVPLPAIEQWRTASSVENPSIQPANTIVAAGSLLSQKSHSTLRKRRLSFLLYSVLATIVLVTLGFTSPLLLPLVHLTSNSDRVNVSKSSTTTQPKQPSATLPMPNTQTSCPSAGKARAAVQASYFSQGRNVVVYSATSYNSTTRKSYGELMSYDVVTGKSSPIITVPNMMLSEAQLSADGQWVIFSAYGIEPGTESRIQMVRIDGKGLQTLYCSPSNLTDLLASPGLSPEQDWSLFFTESTTDNSSTVVVLDLSTGKIIQQFPTTHSYSPITWQNDQSLYLLDSKASGKYDPSVQSSIVSLLINGPSSDPNFLDEMLIPAWCSDLSFSTDLSTIFTSHCTGENSGGDNIIAAIEGPSTIASAKFDAKAGKWSTPTPIFTSETQAIVQIRAVTSTSLLVLVENEDQYNNLNGLWKINTNGKDPVHLFTGDTDTVTSLNKYSQYPGSNVSSDGNSYAFRTASTQATGYDKLFVGSLSGGQPKVIAAAGVGDIDQNSSLYIAGWTTI